MQQIGRRPTPIIQMSAPGFPRPWRAIIEPELTSAQLSIKSVLDNSMRGRAFVVRQRIWSRINNELGVSPHKIAADFGFHHTTVLYALGRLGRQKGKS